MLPFFALFLPFVERLGPEQRSPPLGLGDTPGFYFVGEKAALLKPTSWVGFPFPLSDFIVRSAREEGDSELNLSVGHWVVILFRPSCAQCHDVIQQYLEESNYTTSPNLSDRRLALIAVEPNSVSQFGSKPMNATVATLTSRLRWTVATPNVIRLRNGIVVSVDNE